MYDTFEEGHPELGGNGRFDIEVSRTMRCWVNYRKPLQVIKLHDLISPPTLESQYSYSRSVKHAALDEFIEFMERKKVKGDLEPTLPGHSIPAHIMSGISVSRVRRKLGLKPIVSLDISF